MASALVSLVCCARLHPHRYREMINLNQRREDIEAGLASGQFAKPTVNGPWRPPFISGAYAIKSRHRPPDRVCLPAEIVGQGQAQVLDLQNAWIAGSAVMPIR
ncbi:MAG: hypothetical protein KGM49_02585 [Sphingomonadales bacterium]|nr:hypothetical protein [Sphingomonadales bacterium]